MRRAGPLRDLPLEQFLPPNPNTLLGTPKSQKRQLPPSIPSLYTPTKRRILNEEGIFSPEKTLKSSTSTVSRFALFDQALTGAGSPATKLDFGSPKNTPKPKPSSKCSAHPRESASPSVPNTRRVSSRIAARSSDGPLQDSPHQTPGSSCAFHNDVSMMVDFFTRPPSSAHPPAPLPSSPQSIHYPGFDIFRDIDNTPTCTPNKEKHHKDAVFDKEESKENIAPRRRLLKATTTPSSSETKLSRPLFVNESEYALMTKASGSSSPKKRTTKTISDLTPGHSPQLSSTVRHSRRLVMEAEAEVAGKMD